MSTGGQAITTSAYNAFEKLSRSFTADRDGSLYIYVVNESNVSVAANVYFDETYIVHEKNNTTLQVLQASDYYPFGLSFNLYQSDRLKEVSAGNYSPELRNRYLFQGQELQKDLDLGWYQFKWRMHDPAIGRFGAVDPLSEKYDYNSAYAFSENKLIGHVELEGLESAKAAVDQAMTKFQGFFENLFGVTFDNRRQSKEKPKEFRGQSNKKSIGIGISVDGKGGPNEVNLPQPDPDGKFFSTSESLWSALFGGMTKSQPSKTRGPFDIFMRFKSGADNASQAEENKNPAESDTVVAQRPYTNSGNWTSEYFIVGDDTTLLIIYTPDAHGKNSKNPDSIYQRKSNAKEYEKIRNGDWYKSPQPIRP